MIDLHEMAARLAEVDKHLAEPDWRIETLALFTEVGEFVNELPWRPWRLADQRPVDAADREGSARKELGDIFGTAIRIAMHVGYSGQDIEQAIADHVAEKERRIRAGIDGRGVS